MPLANGSTDWYRRACEALPGGVNSPVRAFRAVGGTPRFIHRALGPRLVDVEGCEYIDYVGSWGAMIAGHAAPEVVDAVIRALRSGFSFGTPCPLEVELAEEIIRRMPWIQRLRMVNSGTEAVMSAVRVARAATGRDRIVKFDGGYHGHADAFLVKAGSGLATLAMPDSLGVPRGATQSTISLPYNDIAALRAAFDRYPGEIAAVLVEPVAGNMGVVPPAGGFLDEMRGVTRAHGALLIFDEVMTGFRVGPAGAAGRYGIAPDLVTLGKVIGGGLPVGAYGGRAALMDLVAPAGPVYQAGTLSGNPVAMAAGLATLRLLDDTAYARLETAGARLQSGLANALVAAGVPGIVQRVGSMLTLYFGVSRVTNLGDAKAADHARFARFFHRLLDRGVHLPPSGYEAWFISLAHDDAVIDETIAHAAAALTE